MNNFTSIVIATYFQFIQMPYIETKLEYGRGRGNFRGAVKCVEIGKNTNGESTLLGRHWETKLGEQMRLDSSLVPAVWYILHLDMLVM